MVRRVHAIPAPLKPLQGFIRFPHLSPSAHLVMSSLNCFKPSPVGTLPHKVPEGSTRVGEKSDSEGEDYDAPTVHDNVSCTDDGCSLQSRSRFQSLRSESPRPDSNVLVRTLKTASLSGRNRSKLKDSSGSNSSPMLSCMKGHSRKGDTPDSKRKARYKHTEVKYDSYDSVDLQPQVGNSNSNLSCLVRSHSDSTCLTVKASKPPDEAVADSKSQLPSDSQLNVLITAPEMQSGDGSNSSAPRSTVYSPIYPNPPTSSFGYLPSSPYMAYDGYLGSPQMGGFMGLMTPPSYGTPNMSVGDASFQGLSYPSPQMSPYSLLFQCPHLCTDPFHQRPCSVESCNVNGGPIPHATGPRQGLDNSYHPAHIAASPMPPLICASNYPRQNHSVSYQTPLSPEDRAPAAPVPTRRQFSNHHYHLPPNPPLQRLRSPPPPSQHQQQPLPPLPAHQTQTNVTIQMPSSRGTAFKKVNNSAAPPPYDSLRTVIGDPTNQRTHHPTGASRPVFFSPGVTASPTSQSRNRNATPNVGSAVSGAMLSGVKKTSPLPSTRLPHQRNEILSPMYQLPKFVNSPPRSLEMSPKQKARLNELRHEKATCEQLWRKNNQLASWNVAMENQVAAKDRELKSCNRRSDELSTKLDIIRKWCEWLIQPPGSQVSRPDRSPYFETDEDTTRWKRAFDELCRLDRKIGNLRSQRRSHPTVARLTSTKPSTTSSPAQSQPSELPPKPSTERSGRNSSAGAQKRDFTPTPSPRLTRPASAPVDKDAPPAAATVDATELSPPPPRPPLPAPSPVLHKARFASRKEINATYLTPLQWRNEHTDEYKRTASENLQAQLASQQLQSIEVLLPEAKRLSPAETLNNVSEVAVPYSEEDSASGGSSSSSLETPKPVRKVIGGPGSRVVDGSEDSAIADTDGSPIVSQESPKKVRDEGALNVGMKPILRKAVEDEEEEAEQRVDGGEELRAVDKMDPGSPRTGVRFHPLALLLDAALEGDLALVKKAAEEVSDVSEANDEGITALHNAVCAGRAEVVEFLVCEAGADVNAGDTDGWTPLHCAASCGNVRLARLLVEHGAALHARTLSDHETALEKCDQADADAECERYLSAELELLGSADNGRVFALFPRGLEAAGPGSPDANIEPDELPIWPNEELRIIDRSPVDEPDWMLAEKVGSADGTAPQQGLVPRAFISRFPIVRVPPASRPMPLPPPDSVGRLPRAFQSPSPIEEEEEDGQEDGGMSDTESGSIGGNRSPQMVEKADDDGVADDDEEEEEEENEMVAVKANNHDVTDENDMPQNGSSDTSSEEKIVRTAM